MQRDWRKPGERGQAMLFFAIVLPALFLALGLVVEGSYVMTEYKRMQAAADMAALVGAQALPCAMTDHDCISAAETRACQYALKNGYSGCTPDATTSSSANVPPLACSPYDFMNYGNSANDASCKSSSAPMSDYSFIEVRIFEPIKVPIFGNAAKLYAHAIARHGQISPKRFAIIVLDPTMSKALTFSGSQGGGLVTVGPIVSDSTAGDSIYTGGQSTQIACSGQWYTSANEVMPPAGPAAGLTSNTGGTTSFAPPTCTGGALDNPTRMLTNVPPVPDPYSSSTLPTGNMSNCVPCNSTAWFYTWTTNRLTGSWNTADNLSKINGGSNYELFPGVYPKGISIAGGNIYVNPGVYTIQNGFNQTGGNICIYGAPACDHQINLANSQDNCSNVSFQTGDTTYVTSDQWYYYCSPWGMWDTSILNNTLSLNPRPASLTAPTFTDGTPLNGVTFYVQSGNFIMNGNGASYLAFPNPCAGTGTTGDHTVSFAAGSASGVYTYPTSSLPLSDGILTSSPGQVYPNADMGFGAECDQSQPPNPRNVWTGELVGQHLHFLVFTRNASTSVSLNGTGLQNWWGIIYSPGTAGCGTACQLQLNGSGGGGLGPPLLSGQIIADNATFSGNATFEIFYSPCRPDGDVCSIGYGTSLVE